MTELKLNMKKGSLKKLLAMALVVCLCLTTFPTSAAFVQAEGTGAGTIDATGDDATGDDAKVAVTGVTLDKTAADVNVGGTIKLSATVAPANATDKTVTWTSSNEKVATVAADGTVMAVAKGNAIITVTTKDGNKTATCNVTVEATVETTVVNVTGVTLDKTAADINVGGTIKLSATVAPANATDKTVTWASSNEKVATVAADGTVKAVAKGTAVITVTTKDGNKTATCNVTVKIPATKVTVSSKQVYVVKGKSVSVKAYVQPLDTTDKVEWTSSNTKVATVKNGKISAKKVGKATITAKAGDKTAKVTVNVVKKAAKAKSVKLNKKAATLKVGKKITLTAKINPTKSTDTLKWSSSNKKVATVDQYGVVTAKKAGTATITVKTSSGKKATCKITVPGVKLKKTSATVKVGKTTKIQIKSKTVKNDKVKSYKSSDKTIATVDKKGKVKGIKAGKATITVTMKSGATATFKVTVK